MRRICIRSVAAGDVKTIHSLLAPFAAKSIILERNEDDIFQHLQEFLVAEYDGVTVGAVAMHVYGENLAEIRSLVVDPDYQKHGVGRLLVEGCEQWLAGLGVGQVFALTYVDGFFVRQGYEIVSKESLPHKIWTVCVHCSRFADCDEVAVQKKLSDAVIQPIPIIEVEEE
jgi:amino-acid N-acetyltransferase